MLVTLRMYFTVSLRGTFKFITVLLGKFALVKILEGTLNMTNLHTQIMPNLHRSFNLQSVYFTKNSGYRSLKNRSCVTVFSSYSAGMSNIWPASRNRPVG